MYAAIVLCVIFVFPTMSVAQIGPITPDALSIETGNANVLTWVDKSDNELCFPVEVKIPGSTDWQVLACVPRNVSTYTDYRYVPGTYCYRVKATNGAGDSAYSNEACKDLLPAFPLPPIVKSARGNGFIAIMWDISRDMLGVHIYKKSLPAGAWSYVADGSGHLGLWHDHKIADGVSYCYRVKGWNYGGDSEYSPDVCP